MKILDISAPLSPSIPVYPGDPAFEIERLSDVEKGDELTLSVIRMCAHTGTHVDAPLHFIPGGATVATWPLGALVGPASVLDLTGVWGEIHARDLERVNPSPTLERILLQTTNSRLWDKPGFRAELVGLAPDAARWLIDRGVKLVGIDYLSIERFGAVPVETHPILLGAGVVILEGLDLRHIAPGRYTLCCLPLSIAHAEGSPARAILIQGSLG